MSAALTLGLMWQRWRARHNMEVNVASVRDQPTVVARAAVRLLAPHLTTQLLGPFICDGDMMFTNQRLAAAAATTSPTHDLYPAHQKLQDGAL